MDTLRKILKNLKLYSSFKAEKALTIQNVAMFGFADAKEKDKLYQDAYKVGYVLAKAGYTVVDGGGPGVMAASSRGAKEGGGYVIGVTLDPDPENKPFDFEGKDKNNPIDKEIKTKTYVERTLTLMKQGQIYVIFNGASGTVSEFGMAWGLARIYFGHHKPLILYGDFWREIMETLKKNLMIRPEETKVYKIVNSPDGVLKAIKDFEIEIQKGEHSHMNTTCNDDFCEPTTEYSN